MDMLGSLGASLYGVFCFFFECSRAESVNVLETAGISRFYSYYVVQQGKVQNCLCFGFASMENNSQIFFVERGISEHGRTSLIPFQFYCASIARCLFISLCRALVLIDRMKYT